MRFLFLAFVAFPLAAFGDSELNFEVICSVPKQAFVHDRVRVYSAKTGNTVLAGMLHEEFYGESKLKLEAYVEPDLDEAKKTLKLHGENEGRKFILTLQISEEQAREWAKLKSVGTWSFSPMKDLKHSARLEGEYTVSKLECRRR
jgi:hypothetical protein